MKENMDGFSNILMQNDVRISHQRIKMLQYLSSNFCHPTADQILSDLKEELPTLSKSTVYKTLNAFVEAKILREITIEDNQVRYEYNLTDHGHFKCEKCGSIYDFDIDISSLYSDEIAGFKINDKNLYLKGVCKSCLDNSL